MRTAELYIEGKQVDLPNDSVIALSYAVNTLYELKTVQGTVSNRITLPLTSNNLEVCGFPDDLNLDFRKTVRKRKTARYLQNGVEIIPDGYVEISGVDGKGISVLITAGNVDFFTLIDGSIRTLDLSRFDHFFEFGPILNSRTNTAGYVYPVIQYGQILETDTAVNVRGLRPATYVKTIVQEIVAGTGFKLNNLLETEPLYQEFYNILVLPFSNDSFNHAERYMKQFQAEEIEIRQNGNLSYRDRTEKTIRWNQEVTDTANLFDMVHGTFKPLRPVKVKLTLEIEMVHTQRTWVTPKNAGGVIHIRRNQEQVLAKMEFPFAKNKYSQDHANVVLTAEVELLPGDWVHCSVEGNRASGSGEVAEMDITNAKFTVEITDDKILYGQEVQLEATLPDIPKKDFLKAIAALFCSIVITDSNTKTVHIVPFKKIKDNLPYALDWSGKISNEHPANSLTIGEYGQQNTAKYKKDASVLPEDFGNAKFPIADENLKLEQELFVLPFAASREANIFNGYSTLEIKKLDVPKLEERTDAAKMFERYQNYNLKTEPRIGMLKFQEIEKKFTDADLTDTTATKELELLGMPVALFSSLTGNTPVTLDLNRVLASYYPDFQIMLNDQRRISLPAILSETDIARLNFFYPIYLSKFGCYFYLSKISNYVGDHQPCTVELIKLY